MLCERPTSLIIKLLWNPSTAQHNMNMLFSFKPQKIEQRWGGLKLSGFVMKCRKPIFSQLRSNYPFLQPTTKPFQDQTKLILVFYLRTLMCSRRKCSLGGIFQQFFSRAFFLLLKYQGTYRRMKEFFSSLWNGCV